jgi:hypothetical protein
MRCRTFGPWTSLLSFPHGDLRLSTAAKTPNLAKGDLGESVLQHFLLVRTQHFKRARPATQRDFWTSLADTFISDMGLLKLMIEAEAQEVGPHCRAPVLS